MVGSQLRFRPLKRPNFSPWIDIMKCGTQSHCPGLSSLRSGTIGIANGIWDATKLLHVACPSNFMCHHTTTYECKTTFLLSSLFNRTNVQYHLPSSKQGFSSLQLERATLFISC
ncbi:hypothetical protein VNO78_23751 [Psophocarpus tetragonolobus]|uniref:Uncharacterized protein n=1 Tax=Psophocarpus tetragonolobus TaxID=3891 RepID=A0AAN9S7A6_PSOTE